MKHFKTPLNLCAVCNHELDGATQVGGENKPNPGDVSICVRCANVAVFDDDLKLRQPTAEEQKLFDEDLLISEAKVLIRNFRKTH